VDFCEPAHLTVQNYKSSFISIKDKFFLCLLKYCALKTYPVPSYAPQYVDMGNGQMASFTPSTEVSGQLHASAVLFPDAESKVRTG
jgi:hypothetical protein